MPAGLRRAAFEFSSSVIESTTQLVPLSGLAPCIDILEDPPHPPEVLPKTTFGTAGGKRIVC